MQTAQNWTAAIAVALVVVVAAVWFILRKRRQPQ
jgi:LPXTG-motif cell wall-anchored protein